MSDPSAPAGPLFTAVEIGLWVAGAIVLWRVQFSASTRLPRREPFPLPPWTITLTEFFRMAFCVIIGGWSAQMLVANLSNRTLGAAAHDSDLWTLVQGTALQLGMLAGVIVAALLPRSPTPPTAGATGLPATPPRYPHPFLAAVGVLLIALPVVTLLGYAWKAVLQALGLDTQEQEIVDIFRQAGSPAELATLIVLAALVAPLTEELIFRAGLFRYLRTRAPRWVALLVPAALFAALHGNIVAFLPLLALGLLFSLAYERTGRIAVTIIAHGLFNLHTILLILAGMSA